MVHGFSLYLPCSSKLVELWSAHWQRATVVPRESSCISKTVYHVQLWGESWPHNWEVLRLPLVGSINSGSTYVTCCGDPASVASTMCLIGPVELQLFTPSFLVLDQIYNPLIAFTRLYLILLSIIHTRPQVAWEQGPSLSSLLFSTFFFIQCLAR